MSNRDNGTNLPRTIITGLLSIVIVFTMLPVAMTLMSDANAAALIDRLGAYGYSAFVASAGDTTFNGSVLPNVDNTQDIGTASLSWQDGYFDGIVTAAGLDAPTGRSATYVIAASDAPAHVKAQADYVCTGTDDDVVIQTYVDLVLALNGSVLHITPGNYYGDTGIVWNVNANYPMELVATGAVFHYSGSGSAWTFNRPTPASLGGSLDAYGIYVIDAVGNGLNGILLHDTNFIRLHNPIAGNFSKANSSGIRIKNTDYQCEHNKIYRPLLWGNYGGIAIESNIVTSSFADTLVSEANITTAAGGYGIKVIQTSGVANVDRCRFDDVTVHLGGNTSTAFDLGTGRYLETTFVRPTVEMGAYTGCTFFTGATTSPPTILTPEIVGTPATSYGGNTGRGLLTQNTFRNLALLADLGQVNILTNSDFATGNPIDSWTGEGTGTTVARESTIVKVGNYSMKASGNAAFAQAYQDLAIPSTYTLSRITMAGWVYCPSTNAAATSILRINDHTSAGWEGVDSPVIPLDNAWHYVTLSNTIRAGVDVVRICTVINNNVGENANILYVSGLVCTVDNLPTLAPGEVRTASGSLVPTGTCTATTVSGTFTESPLTLKPGANTMTCTASGTINVVMPAGSTAVVTSGDSTVTDSPKTCPAGATTLVTVTTGAGADTFTITVHCNAFAWHNPEAQDILIKKIVINRTAAGGTATAEINVGIADNGTVDDPGTEFFENLLANNAAAIHDSCVAAGTSYGTQTIWVNCEDSASATGGWIVGKLDTEIANSLAGSYYIEYVGK